MNDSGYQDNRVSGYQGIRVSGCQGMMHANYSRLFLAVIVIVAVMAAVAGGIFATENTEVKECNHQYSIINQQSQCSFLPSGSDPLTSVAPAVGELCESNLTVHNSKSYSDVVMTEGGDMNDHMIAAPYVNNGLDEADLIQRLSVTLPSSKDGGRVPDAAAVLFSPQITPIYTDKKMTVTAYCPCAKCCGRYADGVTASGHVIESGDAFCAADASVPFGTSIIVPGYNESRPVRVEDRGGAIREGRIDVFFSTHQEAIAWGVRELKVKVLTTD